MTPETVKDADYYKRMYEDTSGEYSPFRDHNTQFGWGIRHMPTGKIFGYIGAKGSCFGVCAALNGKYEAAKVFIESSGKIPNEYFERFNNG